MKIGFCGTMSVGKTTLVKALQEIPELKNAKKMSETEIKNNEIKYFAKKKYSKKYFFEYSKNYFCSKKYSFEYSKKYFAKKKN